MINLIKVCLLVIITSASSFTYSKNVTTAGQYEIHHIAYNSSFLEPAVAQAYGIKRANNLAVINVSVNDTENANLGIPAKVTGTATNLIRQVKHLEFRKVEVDGAIYYLSDYRFSDRDALTFKLTVEIPGLRSPQDVKWQQTLWKD